MNPWLWFWAPQFHFPFSGSVAQRIEPDTKWFFDAIPPEAGNGEVEKQIFDVASYGRQLGLITEVLLGQTDPQAVPPSKAAQALRQLKAVHQEAEGVKQRHRGNLADQAVAVLEKLEASDQDELARVLARFGAKPRQSAQRPALPAPSERKR